MEILSGYIPMTKTFFYILACGFIGGYIRYLRKGTDRVFVRQKLTAGLLSSCLCSLGAFGVCELVSLPFAITTFLMILFGFFDGRLIEAMDKGLSVFIERLGEAIVRILEHWGTK